MVLSENDILISIDPSLNSSGIVVFKGDNPLKYESINPYPFTGIKRLSYNYHGFCRLFSCFPSIACVAYEKQIPQMRYASNAGHILGLAENIGVLKLAIVKDVLSRNPGAILLEVPPNDIKKHATGNSKATKEEMVAAVNGHHLRSIRSNVLDWSVEDIADAYHLGKYANMLLREDKYKSYEVSI